MIRDLKSSDFHVWEDGVEQKVSSIRTDHRAILTARDNFGLHEEWSQTPRGKWSSPDVPKANGSEILQFYEVGYAPSNIAAGKCHRVKVTVNTPNVVVFAPDRYCYFPHPTTDPLLGSDFGKKLEAQLNSSEKGKISLRLSTSIFYTESRTPRLHIVLEFPWRNLEHRWVGVDVKAEIAVLAVVQTSEHAVVARLSDSAYGGNLAGPHAGVFSGVDQVEWPLYFPSRYQTQLDLPPGEYDLRVALGDGEKFGSATIPLNIDGFGSKQIGISSIVLFKRFRNAVAAAKEAAYVNLAPDYIPLVSQDIQVTPTTDTTFDRKNPLPVYFEVDDILIGQDPGLKVGAHMRVVSKTSGAVKDYPWFEMSEYRRSATTTFAVMKGLDVDRLPIGPYRVEVQVTDSAGRTTPWRTADFNLR
jgi:hypothetical protein